MPSPTRPLNDRCPLIVAHGSPSEPSLQHCALRLIAGQVSHILGAPVRGITLAARDAFAREAGARPNAVVYPLFMSDGWFVSTALPKRLAAAGASRTHVLSPFGLDPDLPALMARGVAAAAARAGLEIERTTIILAAHGSPSDPRPQRATEAAATALAGLTGAREVRPCYVDQSPRIADAAQTDGPAICLPFFAARAGHVLGDLPEALKEAAFSGPVLAPVGIWPEATSLIARAIGRALEEKAA